MERIHEEINICMCGAQAGYPHHKNCPYPLFRGTDAEVAKWTKEFESRGGRGSKKKLDVESAIKTIRGGVSPEQLLEQDEEFPGKYRMSMTYEKWDEDAVDAGDTDDRGWEHEGTDYDSLDELLSDTPVRNQSWVGWSSSQVSGRPGREWIISQDDENYRTGERTIYHLFIERKDKKPLSKQEIKFINKTLRIRG